MQAIIFTMLGLSVNKIAGARSSRASTRIYFLEARDLVIRKDIPPPLLREDPGYNLKRTPAI